MAAKMHIKLINRGEEGEVLLAGRLDSSTAPEVEEIPMSCLPTIMGTSCWMTFLSLCWGSCMARSTPMRSSRVHRLQSSPSQTLSGQKS